MISSGMQPGWELFSNWGFEVLIAASYWAQGKVDRSDVQVFHSPVGPNWRYSPRFQSCSGWKPQCCLTLLPLAPWSWVTRVQWLKCIPSKQDTPSRMRYVIRRLWWLNSENEVVRYAESHCQCSQFRYLEFFCTLGLKIMSVHFSQFVTQTKCVYECRFTSTLSKPVPDRDLHLWP